MKENRVQSGGINPIKIVVLLPMSNIRTENPPDFLTARLKDGNTADLHYVVFKGTKRHIYKTSNNKDSDGGVVLYYDEYGIFKRAYHIPTIGWQSLAVRLFFLGDLSNAFVPVYPANGRDTVPVKIWKINYPSDIEKNQKYLETEPPEGY
ncbi:hypothetical protein C6501_16810 [Candidatus Poribacteria bacterium]|nr:MAG: hypothetical protein C6501_16810 [Candidatus Poribacteria bacterium]